MIVGKKLTASKSRIVAGRFSGGSISPVGTLPADFDFTNGGNPLTALPAILTALNATYTRNSVKNVVQNGALVALSANQFGTSYDPVTGLYGYVPEPAATNLATNSDGNAATYSTTTNVADGTAVPGFTNGIAFGDNSVQRLAYKSVSVTSGTTYSVSFFVIMDDGGAPVVGLTTTTGDFRLVADNSGVNVTGLMRLIGSNVYRVSASWAATATAGRSFGCIKYTGQSARTFRITGIQVETGLRATSYINCPSSSTVARAADVLTVPLANIIGFSSAGYTLAADQRMDTTLAASTIGVELNDGAATNLARAFAGSGVNATTSLIYASVSQSNANFGTLGLTRKKYAVSYTLNSAKCALAGVAGTEDTSCTMPVNLTTLALGQSFSGGSQYNGFLFSAKLIPTPLTQAQLNGLTT